MHVFPACAGMNRNSNWRGTPATCVPRLRGDEPYGNIPPSLLW